MELKELANQSLKDLQDQLALERDRLRELRFKDSNKQLKNVRELRQTKRLIARILTMINKQTKQK